MNHQLNLQFLLAVNKELSKKKLTMKAERSEIKNFSFFFFKLQKKFSFGKKKKMKPLEST